MRWGEHLSDVWSNDRRSPFTCCGSLRAHYVLFDSFAAATFGVLIAFGVVIVGLTRPDTSVTNARRRVADALKLRPWPRSAVIWAALFVLIVNVGGVTTAATDNLLMTAYCLVAAFIALAATGLALRRR